MSQPSELDPEDRRWPGPVLAFVRWSSWLFLGVLLLAGVGGVVGGTVTIVVGVVQTAWASIARGLVGVAIGGVWLALAHGLWGTVRPQQTPET